MAEPQTMFEQIILTQLNLIIQNQVTMDQHILELNAIADANAAKVEKIFTEVKKLAAEIKSAPDSHVDITEDQWAGIKKKFSDLGSNLDAIDALSPDVTTGETPATGTTTTPDSPASETPATSTPASETPATSTDTSTSEPASTDPLNIPTS